jgi:hypothetical protein
MRVLHVKIMRGDEFLVAQGLEEPGVITQGKTYDELVGNIRDAAELLLQDKDIHIELLLPPRLVLRSRKRGTARRKPALSAA